MPYKVSLPHRWVFTSALLVCAVGLAGCDAPEDPALRTKVTANLTQFGIDEIRANPEDEGTYLLFDGKGNDVGQIDLEIDGEDGIVQVDLEGESSQLHWSGQEIELRCEASPQAPTDQCQDAALVGALVAEAEGVDVPHYSAPPQLLEENQFRFACETVTTWAMNCNACYDKAYNASQYSDHSNGKCTVGWFDVSCWHTFCSSDDYEIEGGGAW